MSRYAALLSTLMEAVLANETDTAPDFLREKKGFPSTAQLAVYTDAYRIRLNSVLREAYSALVHYMGDEIFGKLAEDYIATHPPRHFNLDRYPIGFAAYINEHSADGIAQELALLESAMAQVYMMEESAPLSARWITAQTQESLAAAKLKPRTASACFAFDYSVNDYVNALREGVSPALPARAKNWLLVYRHNYLVQRLALGEGEYRLLTLLDGNTPLATALEDGQFVRISEKALQTGEFMQWFARLSEKGCLCLPTS